MNRIKVLVVDDSVFMQRVIKKVLEKNEKTEVAAVAGDGLQALEILKKREIDVVTMDIRMPRMDGFEALKAIMDTKPVPVIMISSYTKKGAEDTIRYLETGAVDFITKPSLNRANDLQRFERELNIKIAVAATARLIGPLPEKRPAIQLPPGTTITHERVLRHVIAIGCSTGGPKALQQVLQVIPGSIEGAVLVVQHMPPGFTRSLAERLDAVCQLKVKEAQHYETVRAGYCYIAPGDYHMRVFADREEGIRIALDKGDIISGHRPSVDALFESVSDIEAEKVVAVILTGMGSDGSRGIVKLKQKRDCVTIAQDRDTSIVFGMPGSAIKTGFVDKVTALGDIGEEILKSLEVL